MPTKLTQSLVNRVRDDHPAGTQLHDAEVSGLRLVVGKSSCSWKLVGRINDGSKRYVSVILGRTDELSLKTARDEATRVRLALRRGVDPRQVKTTVPSVEEGLRRYVASRPELSPATVEWYEAKVRNNLKSVARLPCDKVDRETVRVLHERLTREVGAYGANSAMRVLKLVLNDVARTFDLPPNPVTRAVRMNPEKARDWAVSPDDMPLLWERLDAMEDRTRRACWMLMLFTGLRSGNARSVEWSHVDGDLLFVPRAKSGRSFTVPLPALVVQALAELPRMGRFVFASPASKSGHIEELRRTDGFPYAPHQMRHSYRTHALEAGIDFQAVTLLMDHSNPHVSFRYVTREHLTGHLRECQDRIAARLLGFRGR
ncbi:integrase family protein [uncultured Paracoccus sp.]|uniref:tyrosine-type recombinase/integrase n=1 Tax=uncultured Paracoccus sp. TaxID=189685 RepID=UPI0025E5AF7B|nr:integrase family protein [uncultured Paracoccus sp.]